jgi:hypothetical protein
MGFAFSEGTGIVPMSSQKNASDWHGHADEFQYHVQSYLRVWYPELWHRINLKAGTDVSEACTAFTFRNPLKFETDYTYFNIIVTPQKKTQWLLAKYTDRRLPWSKKIVPALEGSMCSVGSARIPTAVNLGFLVWTPQKMSSQFSCCVK